MSENTASNATASAQAGAVEQDILLDVQHLTKRFAADTNFFGKATSYVQAVDDVSFRVRRGEVHALVGENGAGKSTLIKCISGAIRPDSGKIFLDNKEFLSIGPKDTIEHGIVTVYQELNLIPSLSVAENVFVGERRGGKVLYNRQKVEQDCKKILEDFHIDIDATAIVNELSVAQRQLVEIVRAISRNVRILILDEPTSSLTVHETQFLFDTIRRLKQNGVTIIYISHIFEETFALADRITVMRDGRYIHTLETSKTSKAALGTDMQYPPLKRTDLYRKHGSSCHSSRRQRRLRIPQKPQFPEGLGDTGRRAGYVT